MITLKKYITGSLNDNNANDNNVTINDELEQHFYCEFILQESFNYSYFQILEKYGSYIGQSELIIDLSKEIYLSIKNNDPSNKFELEKNDLSDYSNIFFKELIVCLVDSNSAFVSNKSNYIEDDKIFDKVIININYEDCKQYNSLCSTIMHEMLHAYNEYCSYLKNSPIKLKELTNRKSSYYKTLFNDTDVTPTNVCKRICNNIRQFEQNAYLSELSVELEHKRFKISKYNNVNDAYRQALEIFRNSDIWTQYTTLWNYIIDLQYDGSNEDKDEFARTYNSINNTKLTYNKIYKKLDGVFNKIIKRIETAVPKIFYDYYQKELSSNIKESISGRQNNALIKFIEFEKTTKKFSNSWKKYCI